MSRNPIHPSAGWYDGDDPAMAEAFRTMQRNFQRLPRDPLVKITATQTKGGCYACDWYDDKAALDPTVAGSLDALAGRTKMNGSFLAVNGLENGANTHTVPLGSIVPATLQYRTNGEPYFVFQWPPTGVVCATQVSDCLTTGITGPTLSAFTHTPSGTTTFPAGNYRIVYCGGAMQYNNDAGAGFDTSWWIHGLHTNGFTYFATLGFPSVFAPGTRGTNFLTAAAAEAANGSAYADFTLSAPDNIGLEFFDEDYAGNFPDPTNGAPAWKICAR